MPNHLTGIDVAGVLPAGVDASLYAKRAVVTKKLKPVPVEAIARVPDRQRLEGLPAHRQGQRHRTARRPTPGQLAEPIFTPSTKAAVGGHDENIDFDAMVKTVGAELAERVRDATLRIYRYAADVAAERGILLADTKFEFGTDEMAASTSWANADAGFLALLACRPVRSRHQPALRLRQQFVRDYLEPLDWNKTAPVRRCRRRSPSSTRTKVRPARCRRPASTSVKAVVGATSVMMGPAH